MSRISSDIQIVNVRGGPRLDFQIYIIKVIIYTSDLE